MEIRIHGRGGQGGVTCAKILAAAYARMGKSVQAFGDYAAERSGAPIRAYTRVSDAPITNRNKVYHPDHLLVLDPALLGEASLAGLAEGGSLLINSPDPPERFAERFPGTRPASLDCTAIARRHGIGTRSVVIVNTTIAGAFARTQGIPLEVLEGAYEDLGLAGDLPAALEAYAAVRIAEPRPRAAVAGAVASPPPAPRTVAPAASTAPPPVLALTAHTEGPETGLKTGDWRSQLPRFVRNLAPCNAWCPAGIDVVGFVQALAREGPEAAAGILAEATPLASVCGRVCPGFCMLGCNRRDYDGAVNVRGLERWVADHAPIARAAEQPTAQPRRLAVVGSGPAGLSAAYALARQGHRTELFEGESVLGGVLRTGIPGYRLPDAALERDLQGILDLGVEAHTGAFLGQADLERLSQDFDAVILATGLQQARDLDIPGSELAGVEQGIAFLHRSNLEPGARLTGHVVVLGGGNTAMDCARSALRFGADRVTVAYRRGRSEMPAIREEIEEAMEEGVTFRFLQAPVAFVGEDRVTGLELAEVELGPPDDSGRRRPLVTERRSRIACDHVLLALGQSPDLALLPEDWKLQDGRAFRSGEALNVFASGDLSTGAGTVTHAIGDGRRVARQALIALGEALEPLTRPDRADAVPRERIRFDYFARRSPAQLRQAAPAERIGGFDEVSQGLPDASEAERCLSCGSCTYCDTCLIYCPEGIIHREPDGTYAIDAEYCKGCGICLSVCPRCGLEMVT
ncbi:MAG: FAD-dependent oxidoreductase [Caldilineae bacterium]|nr:FAD-dependent oxidoreductase [Caldilineae bacterium]